jgi:hypothetical protein
MGIVRMGPPHDLVLRLRDASGVTTFIETGTYEGHTARWAAGAFPRVITIEASPLLHAAARVRLAEFPNVELVLGDSRQMLGERLAELTSPAIFWLDAHWSGGPTFGEHEQCPLLGELDEIRRTGRPEIILIDDARLFLSPPPPPHRRSDWPSIDALLARLGDGRQPYVASIVDDMIVAVPPRLLGLLDAYGSREGVQYTPLQRSAECAGVGI